MAALAYGTESVPAVDKIVGPGNIYVATAKRKVFGKVGIDMIAGPSEILVLADGTCNPAWVAADLLSQAEHDKLASPVLVTDSWDLAKAVQAELEVQIPQLPRAAIARASVDTNGKIIVTDDMNKAIEAVNIIAPEHLEICVDDPFAVLNSVQNAGSIFLGKTCPRHWATTLPARTTRCPPAARRGSRARWASMICEEVELYLLHPRSPRRGAGTHRQFCRARGVTCPCQECDDPV